MKEKKDFLDKTFQHIVKHKIFYMLIAFIIIIGITYDISKPPIDQSELIVPIIIKFALTVSWIDLSKILAILAFPFIMLAWMIHGVGFHIAK